MKRVNFILWILLTLILFSCTAATSTDVLVYSGEPEGIMAAIAAAREGADTVLVMERKYPGGLMTAGGLNYLDLNYGPEGNVLNRGLFHEWYQKMGSELTFSPEKAIDVFNKMLAEEDKLTVYRNFDLEKVKVDKNQVKNLEFASDKKNIQFNPDAVIDANADADLATAAGSPFYVGNRDLGMDGDTMAVTLNIPLDGVNWKSLQHTAKSDKYGPTSIDSTHAWGFIKLGDMYNPDNENIRLRGLNIARIPETDTVYINGMLIFGVDPLQEKSLNRAHRMGKKEAEHVLEFLKKEVPAFKNASLLSFPEELYVRESRHLQSISQLQTEDLFYGRIPEDTAALGSYPLDYQAFRKEYQGFVLFDPPVYGVPFRSLVPPDISNLLVVGRSSGYSSLAAASARVLPTGMSAGETAGRAGAFESNFHKLIEDEKKLDLLQDKSDINPDQYDSKPIISDNNAADSINFLISWGLVIGGYNNDFRLKEPIKEYNFSQLILKGLKRRQASILYEWVPGSLETLSENKELTRDRAAMLLLAAASKRVREMDPSTYYRKARQEGLISDTAHKEIVDKEILDRKSAFILAAEFLNRYPIPGELESLRENQN
ncbi:MAG: FAD-dependent oxidoreductase [Halanaerobiaceae bacterium]